MIVARVHSAKPVSYTHLVYGARAANGVVLVTTKKGKLGYLVSVADNISDSITTLNGTTNEKVCSKLDT